MYVVVGATGYLGAYFIKNILELTNELIIATGRNISAFQNTDRIKWVSLDISNLSDIDNFNETYLKNCSCNKIIYLAAYHHPDMVEKNPKIAWNTNVTALSYFINTVSNVTKFFYPSSDSVYGNSVDGHAFVETDTLNPVNRYGMHKCVAEKLVTSYGYNVVRFPFLISPSLVPGKPHFYDVIVKTITDGQAFEMFSDSYRSAISFDQAAKFTLELMNMEDTIPQLINVCSDKGYSKYDVGLMIAKKVGVSPELIVPISISSSTGIFEAKRAESTLMDNTLLKGILNLESVELEL